MSFLFLKSNIYKLYNRKTPQVQKQKLTSTNNFGKHRLFREQEH